MKGLYIFLLLPFLTLTAQKNAKYYTDYQLILKDFHKDKGIFSYNKNTRIMTYLEENPKNETQSLVILKREDYTDNKKFYVIQYATDRSNMSAEDKLFENIVDYYFFFDYKGGKLLKVQLTFSEIRKGVERLNYLYKRELFTEEGKKMYESLP